MYGRHYLSKNKATWTPTQCCVVSCATHDNVLGEYPSGHERALTAFAAHYWRRGKEKTWAHRDWSGTTPSEFWMGIHPVLSADRPLWLFAHDLRTQLTVLGFWELVDHGMFALGRLPDSRKRGCLVTAAPPTIVSVHEPSSGGKLIALDLHNWWPQWSWAEAAKRIGTLEPRELEPWDETSTQIDEARCKSAILFSTVEGLIRWVLDHDLGMFRLTAGGQAMGAYRHRFIQEPIEIHDVEPLKRVEQSAIYCGQVETFYFGKPKTRIWQLDCNSLYPYVMRANPYPAKLLEHGSGTLPPYDVVAGPPTGHIATVEIRSDVERYPFRHEGVTRFAAGHFTTTLAGPELMRAFKSESIYGLHSWSRYRLADLFSGYIDYFWNLRQEYKQSGEALFESLCKLLLNSLWGKFAQQNPEWQLRPDQIPWERWAEWCVQDVPARMTHHYRSCGGVVEESIRDRGWRAWSAPAISAFVAAHAREYMRLCRRVAGDRHVYYQGCDSLCVDETGHKNLDQAGLLSDHKLGLFRCVAESDDCEFWGSHNYRIGQKRVAISIKGDAEQVTEFAWEQESLESIHHIASRQPTGTVHVKRGTVHLRPRLKSGLVSDDGWVTPLTIGEPCDD